MTQQIKVGDLVRVRAGQGTSCLPEGAEVRVREIRKGMLIPDLEVYHNGDPVSTGLYLERFEHVPPKTGEADPTGLDAHSPGAKLDAGKVMAAQILAQFPRALTGVAEVGSFGARKYTMGGWLSVPNGILRYADAKVRHWLARARGEKFDKDSKLHHLKHEAWNVLAELELTLQEEEKANAND